MIYFSQAQTDALLLEDIQGGDLTTRALGIGAQPGVIEFHHRQGGCVSGIAVARQMLTSLGLIVTDILSDGERASAGQRLIRAHGPAAALHQGWKAVQNVLEWSCGVSGYLVEMLSMLHQRYPDGQIACTRKAIPGTRLLATQAILAAGGIIHRGGCAETVLLFANHRRFLTNPNDWTGAIAHLRSHAPEKRSWSKRIRQMRHWPPCAPPPMSYNSTNLPPGRRLKLPVRPLLWPPVHAGADRRHYPRLAGGLSRLRYQTLYHFRALLRSTCGYQS